MPPKPEPNYAQRAQNCEQEIAALRLQNEFLSNVDHTPDVESARYLQIINDQEQIIRQNDSTITAMRTDLLRVKENSEQWQRRANEAELKVAELRNGDKRFETFLSDLRRVMRSIDG